jgi:hypothetical protein
VPRGYANDFDRFLSVKGLRIERSDALKLLEVPKPISAKRIAWGKVKRREQL